MEYEQDLLDGKYVAYWDNGKTKLSGKYITGTPEGAWIKFDEEGNPFLTTIYKEGKEVQWNQYQIKD
jgi:antitoxin component YwqK of YwqJK toxin-antitoxin module